MKKGVIIILAILVVGAIVCAVIANNQSKQAEEPMLPGMANPLTELASSAELAEATGVNLEAPDGSSDVAYISIDMGDGSKIADVRFTLDGVNYVYRAIVTGATALEDCEDISGNYSEWSATALVDIEGRNGKYYRTKSCEDSRVEWLDVVPGVFYNLSAEGKIDEEDLLDLAKTIFVPMQGEV